MSATKISRIRILGARHYTTRASGLNATARAKAEQVSADWKGTSLTGGTTKNYIGGEFVESKTDKWIELHDPVCAVAVHLFVKQTVLSAVNTNIAVTSSRNHQY